MYVPFRNIKRTASLTAVLVILFITAGLSCPAQNGDRLPDSVSTAVDSTPSETTDNTVSSSADSGRQEEATPVADSVILRAVPESEIVRYKKKEVFDYANDPSYWMREQPAVNKENGFLVFLTKLVSSNAFWFLLYALLTGVLLFALYKIITENNLHLFYKSPRKAKTVTGAEDGTDLEEEDLDRKIQEALRAKDHRLGTRYLFLKALRLLNERDLIGYHAQATNQEYISQMSTHAQGKSFRFLAEAYEHVWYGEFSLSEEQFAWLVQYFQDFYKTIGEGSGR